MKTCCPSENGWRWGTFSYQSHEQQLGVNIAKLSWCLSTELKLDMARKCKTPNLCLTTSQKQNTDHWNRNLTMKRSGLDFTEWCGEVHLTPCICTVTHPEQAVISKHTMTWSNHSWQRGWQNHVFIEASKSKILWVRESYCGCKIAGSICSTFSYFSSLLGAIRDLWKQRLPELQRQLLACWGI